MAVHDQTLFRALREATGAADPLRALDTLVEARREIEALTRAQVARALRSGRSFGDVARALGVSRQAAHRRYRDLADPRAAVHRRHAPPTDHACRLVAVAREEALRAGAAGTGGEHVVLAALRSSGRVAWALGAEGVTLEAARSCMGAFASRDRHPADELGEILHEATRVAGARGQRWVDAEALLLGAVADADGSASRLLAAAGADVAAIRRRLGYEPVALGAGAR